MGAIFLLARCVRANRRKEGGIIRLIWGEGGGQILPRTSLYLTTIFRPTNIQAVFRYANPVSCHLGLAMYFLKMKMTPQAKSVQNRTGQHNFVKPRWKLPTREIKLHTHIRAWDSDIHGFQSYLNFISCRIYLE